MTTYIAHRPIGFSPPAVVPGMPLTLAFEVNLKKGWHIYWLNSGDAGIPPSVTWVLPEWLEAPLGLEEADHLHLSTRNSCL